MPVSPKAVFHVAGLVVLAQLVGCGGSGFELAPVSGSVTLDGKPLQKATVIFEPKAVEGTVNAGPVSSGRTDAEGKFTLKTPDGRTGAVVGDHTVKVWTAEEELKGTGGAEGEVSDGSGDDIYSGAGNGEKAPARYNANSELKKTVPPDGADDADFKLESGS